MNQKILLERIWNVSVAFDKNEAVLMLLRSIGTDITRVRSVSELLSFPKWCAFDFELDSGEKYQFSAGVTQWNSFTQNLIRQIDGVPVKLYSGEEPVDYDYLLSLINSSEV